MLRLEVIFSQFTLKVSGQFFTAGKGDVGGEDKELLESEEVWSNGMHEDICVGRAEMDTGSTMGKILHVYGSISGSIYHCHCCMIHYAFSL